MGNGSDPGDDGRSDLEAMAALTEAQRLYAEYLRITSLTSYFPTPDDPEAPAPNLNTPLNVVIKTRP
jgi:hypothetical protein